jgi:hypothetical protein
MDSIAAKEGISWIKQGFALFRRQPSELSMLFLLYMLLMFSLSLIPLIGQLLPLMLVPAFTMAFMQACVEIEADRKVKPSLLLTAFRSPALGTLLKLGRFICWPPRWRLPPRHWWTVAPSGSYCPARSSRTMKKTSPLITCHWRCCSRRWCICPLQWGFGMRQRWRPGNVWGCSKRFFTASLRYAAVARLSLPIPSAG